MNILLNNNKRKTYLTVSVLGKSYKLDIKYKNNLTLELNTEEKRIDLCLPKKYKSMEKTKIINMSIEKMYDEIAEEEIDNSMEKIRILLGFAPEDYKIERMKGTFCKCNKNKNIIINPDIVKYNKQIIEITLIQAFCKTKYNINSKTYKEVLNNALIKYEEIKYNTKQFKKIVNKAS